MLQNYVISLCCLFVQLSKFIGSHCQPFLYSNPARCAQGESAHNRYHRIPLWPTKRHIQVNLLFIFNVLVWCCSSSTALNQTSQFVQFSQVLKFLFTSWILVLHQDGGCRGSAVRKAEVDPLLWKRHLHHVPGSTQWIWPSSRRVWQWGKTSTYQQREPKVLLTT